MRLRSRSVARATWLVAIAVVPAAASPALSQVVIDDPGQGPVLLQDVAAVSPEELGALTWRGGAFATGDRFFSLSDNNADVFDLRVDIDPASGTITTAQTVGIDATVTGGGGDFESISRFVDAGNGRLVIASEGSNTLLLYPGENAAATPTPLAPPVPFPGNFAAGNFGLESVAANADGSVIYTTSEAPLTVDTAGLHRLVRFDGTTAGKQVAFAPTPATGFFLNQAISGVVDLEVLPNGDLLVLERAFGPGNLTQGRSLAMISWIKAADLNAALDVSGDPQLIAGFLGVPATVLWQKAFDVTQPANFEGMALGETLDDGRVSLLLISDDGDLSQSFLTYDPEPWLYPLIVTIPEPSSLTAMLGVLALGMRRRVV